MRIKRVLLVRPPRYMWPFVSESDNFLLPLGLPCIAAAMRQRSPHLEIKIVDCPPLKIGWKSLARIIREFKPDMVGAGEEAVYHYEAVKLFRLAKEINPGVVTIAGGHFFSWMVEHSLKEFPIDVIVRFEGELTAAELVVALNEGKDLAGVKGIAFMREGKVEMTPERPFVENLDDLPLPAFDLMPMGGYGKSGFLWPQSVTLEHSRGCIDQCTFCSLWTFWGKHIKADIEHGQFEVKPRYRTKSVDRMLEEIDIIYKKYDRKYIFWGDPTFNAEAKWNEEFCDKLLKRGYKDLKWWAFVRADFLLRDEKLGILEKMVKAGLVHPLVGVERGDTDDLRKLKKSVYTHDLVKEVFMIFKHKYPHVFRQGTLITCLPFDTRESMMGLVEYCKEIDIDYPAFQVIAPVPGTYLYEEAKEKNLLAEKDFTKYDWVTPVMHSYTGLSRKEFAALNLEVNKRYMLYRPHWLVRGLFSRFKHKRRLYYWWFTNTVRMLLLDIWDSILGRKNSEGATAFMRLRKPVWYDN